MSFVTPSNPIIPEVAYSEVRALAARRLETSNGYVIIDDANGNLSLFYGGTWLQTLATPTSGPGGNVNYPAITNPTGTDSSSGLMMGIGLGGGSSTKAGITPKTSGNVKVTASMNAAHATAGGLTIAQLNYGTGDAPANGVAKTGTIIGTTKSSQSSGAGTPNIISFTGYISGLALGTAIWVDAVVTGDGSDVSSLTNIDILIQEV